MTISPRMRIAKPGKSVFSTDPRDFVLDERYNMFKYHSTSTTSVTLTAGSTENSATVTHNLGYVPAYIVYYQRSDESVERLVPSLPFGVDFDIYPWAYATTTGVVVGVSSATPYNQVTADVSDGYTNIGTNILIGVGNYSGSPLDCGYRFDILNVAKNASISSATLDFGVDLKVGSSDVYLKTWGIAEDNVGAFGSDLGKTKTTASVSQTTASPTNSTFGINVKTIVEEITTRSGWASGNAIGFYTFDNGTSANNYVYDELFAGQYTTLSVVLSGSVTVSFRVVIFKDKISP